jgi:hypothetical protein
MFRQAPGPTIRVLVQALIRTGGEPGPVRRFSWTAYQRVVGLGVFSAPKHRGEFPTGPTISKGSRITRLFAPPSRGLLAGKDPQKAGDPAGVKPGRPTDHPSERCTVLPNLRGASKRKKVTSCQDRGGRGSAARTPGQRPGRGGWYGDWLRVGNANQPNRPEISECARKTARIGPGQIRHQTPRFAPWLASRLRHQTPAGAPFRADLVASCRVWPSWPILPADRHGQYTTTPTPMVGYVITEGIAHG